MKSRGNQPKLRSKLLPLGSLLCTYMEVRRYLAYLSKILFNPNTLLWCICCANNPTLVGLSGLTAVYHHSNNISTSMSALIHKLDKQLCKCHQCISCTSGSSNLSQCNFVLVILHAWGILFWLLPLLSIACRHPHSERCILHLSFSNPLLFETSI